MTDEETIKQIRKMREGGISVSSIARELGLSRPTVLKYLHDHSAPKVSQHTPPSKIIPVNRPSERVVKQREDVEIVGLEVEKQKSLKELEKVTGPKEHPALVEKRARVEVVKLDLDEYEARKRLEALKEEERRKAQTEEEARVREEIEQERVADERRRLAERERWIQKWQDWALSQGIPWGVSLPTEWKFKVKDAVGEVLKNRSEDEPKWDIEQLVKNTINAIIQPYLDKLEAERKTEEAKRREARKANQIQSNIYQVDSYISSQGLEAYFDQETREEVRKCVHDHFMKTLTGTELSLFIYYEVGKFINTFLKPIREKIREAQEEESKKKEKERLERERQEREKKEAKERAFLEKLKEENEEERIEGLLRVGMNRFNSYLITNRKDLGSIDAKEKEEARRYLEGELKGEIEGNETDEEVEKIADEILDDYFFEE